MAWGTPGAARRRWSRDRARYPPRAWLREPSLYAVALLRVGQALDERGGRAMRVPGAVYWLSFRILEIALGVGVTKNTEVGGGLRIWHFGGIFINEGTVIGTDCTLRQGVTIGSRRDDGPSPVLGDEVDVGAYAQILGGVSIGSGASVGAGAMVLTDVPAGAIAVGNPARVIERSSADTPHPA